MNATSKLHLKITDFITPQNLRAKIYKKPNMLKENEEILF